MANTEPTIQLPSGLISNSSSIEFEIYGNPDIKGRISIQSEENNIQVGQYGYVDATTNTFIHSHAMTFKKGANMI